MYLLNYDQIIKNIQSEHSNYLKIHNFKNEDMQHTSYYFRLGKNITRFDESGEQITTVLDNKNKKVIIRPNEYILVESIEIFDLSDKVKGSIGSLSEMIQMGLQLNLDLDKRSDQEMKNLLNQGISNNIKIVNNKINYFKKIS